MESSYSLLVGLIIATVLVIIILAFLYSTVNNATAQVVLTQKDTFDKNHTAKDKLSTIDETLARLKQAEIQKEYDENVAKSNSAGSK